MTTSLPENGVSPPPNRSRESRIDRERYRPALVVTDLDGTAIDSPTSDTASPRLTTAVAVLEEMGTRVVGATGRSGRWSSESMRSMGLRGLGVVLGGSMILDTQSKDIVWSRPLEPADQEALAVVLSAFTFPCAVWNDFEGDTFLSGLHPLTKDACVDPLYFLALQDLPDDVSERVLSALEGIPGIAVSSMISSRTGVGTELHVTNVRATKRHAVEEVLLRYRVSQHDTIGVGNADNDLGLLAACGYGVCVAGSSRRLTEVADRIIGRVGEDGLAVYFEELAELPPDPSRVTE